LPRQVCSHDNTEIRDFCRQQQENCVRKDTIAETRIKPGKYGRSVFERWCCLNAEGEVNARVGCPERRVDGTTSRPWTFYSSVGDPSGLCVAMVKVRSVRKSYRSFQLAVYTMVCLGNCLPFSSLEDINLLFILKRGSIHPLCWSQWPRGLRHQLSSLARTLGSWGRIPFKAWMSVWVYSMFVLFCV
jgi:hypothetical protein